jgi:hypothetical protein
MVRLRRLEGHVFEKILGKCHRLRPTCPGDKDDIDGSIDS